MDACEHADDAPSEAADGSVDVGVLRERLLVPRLSRPGSEGSLRPGPQTRRAAAEGGHRGVRAEGGQVLRERERTPLSAGGGAFGEPLRPYPPEADDDVPIQPTVWGEDAFLLPGPLHDVRDTPKVCGGDEPPHQGNGEGLAPTEFIQQEISLGALTSASSAPGEEEDVSIILFRENNRAICAECPSGRPPCEPRCEPRSGAPSQEWREEAGRGTAAGAGRGRGRVALAIDTPPRRTRGDFGTPSLHEGSPCESSRTQRSDGFSDERGIGSDVEELYPGEAKVRGRGVVPQSAARLLRSPRRAPEDPLEEVLTWLDGKDVRGLLCDSPEETSNLNEDVRGLLCDATDEVPSVNEEFGDVSPDREAPPQVPPQMMPQVQVPPLSLSQALDLAGMDHAVPSKNPTMYSPVTPRRDGSLLQGTPKQLLQANSFRELSRDLGAPVTSRCGSSPPPVVDEDDEWMARQRLTGAIGRLVRYLEGDMPSEDILGLRATGRGRIMVTGVRDGGPAMRAGVSAGDELVSITCGKTATGADGSYSISGNWKRFGRLPPNIIHASLQAPVTLIFLGFVGKLHAEVRIKQPMDAPCGLPPHANVLPLSRGASENGSVRLCEEVVFSGSRAPIFFAMDRTTANVQGSAGPSPAGPQGMFELQRKDARELVRGAISPVASV